MRRARRAGGTPPFTPPSFVPRLVSFIPGSDARRFRYPRGSDMFQFSVVRAQGRLQTEPCALTTVPCHPTEPCALRTVLSNEPCWIRTNDPLLCSGFRVQGTGCGNHDSGDSRRRRSPLRSALSCRPTWPASSSRSSTRSFSAKPSRAANSICVSISRSEPYARPPNRSSRKEKTGRCAD
jgi:hypothetical protein